MTPFTLRVRDHLRRCDLKQCNADIVARHFEVSTNTLRRRLRHDGCTFCELYLTTQRERFAALWAENPTMRGAYFADELGYQDLGSFYRAFPRIVPGVRNWSEFVQQVAA